MVTMGRFSPEANAYLKYSYGGQNAKLKFKIKNFVKKYRIWFIVSGFLLVSTGVFYFLRTNNYLNIEGKNSNSKIIYPSHPLTGIKCANYDKRPYAVMLAEDKEARPLSGIVKADIVVEMQVVKKNITRMMALFICVRSSRHDFIPIAASFDAIFAHWGGSYIALNDLKRGIIDNIDAMINPNNAFYRKTGIYAPHDGFTSYNRLKNTAEFLNYRLESKFEGYKHKEDISNKDTPSTIVIGYQAPYNVNYVYNSESNSYFRWRGGKPEQDKLDNSQAESKVLIVMFTNSRQLDKDYNDVDVLGDGGAIIFQNGEMERVKWSKALSPLESKLKFSNSDGEEIPFVSGKMWIHVVDYGTTIRWGEEAL